MTPVEPVDITSVITIGALNPATIVVAYLMGRAADQWQKIVVAALAGAIAGSALLWLVAETGLPYFAKAGRAAGGIFVLQCLLGVGWAALGYWRAQRKA